MTVAPEIIAAFADGELGGDDKLRVEAAIAADPKLAKQVERHRKLKAMLAARYSPITSESVPDRFTELIEKREQAGPSSGDVVSMAKARARRGLPPSFRRWMPIAGPAIAASLVLAIWQPWQSEEADRYASTELADLLENRLVADQSAVTSLRILLSFEARDGRLCRAWRGVTDGGIACRNRQGWKLEQQFAVGGTASRQFRQAASEGDILAVAQNMASGEALDARSEEQAMKNGWMQ